MFLAILITISIVGTCISSIKQKLLCEILLYPTFKNCSTLLLPINIPNSLK